jgi:hypothetical protein
MGAAPSGDPAAAVGLVEAYGFVGWIASAAAYGPPPAAAASRASTAAAAPCTSPHHRFSTPPPAAVLYLAWAFTPEALLRAHAVTYYPSKYWAAALPAWCCVTILAGVLIYEGLCLADAPAGWEEALPPPAPGGAAGGAAGAGAPLFDAPGAEPSLPPAELPVEVVEMVLGGGWAPAAAEAEWRRRRAAAEAPAGRRGGRATPREPSAPAVSRTIPF